MRWPGAPLLPFGRRLVPEELHGQIRRPATAWNKYQQGTCPQDHDRAQGFREEVPITLVAEMTGTSAPEIRCQFIILTRKDELTPDYCGDNLAVAFAVRQKYITDALAREVPITLVAEMTGTSAEMIARVYSYISEKKSLLLDAANKVRPS